MVVFSPTAIPGPSCGSNLHYAQAGALEQSHGAAGVLAYFLTTPSHEELAESHPERDFEQVSLRYLPDQQFLC